MSNDVPPIRQWLLDAAARGASDLHLVSGYAPICREHGDMLQLASDPLSPQSIHAALESICDPIRFEAFQRDRNLDFAFEISDDSPVQQEVTNGNSAGPFSVAEAQSQSSAHRFRANFFYSGENPGACIRVIPSVIPGFEWSNFPLQLAETIASFRNGLIVFSGVTGSGKTTSMAMMIRMLSERSGQRIVTIEDPVEYRFPQTSTSVITQREVGRDVKSFAEGLKFAMRQDPDIILVGEIRDREAAQIALSAAETGHLVLTTLHTRDAKGTVTRFLDIFPPQNHSEIGSMLAISLRAVVNQHLLPSIYPGEKRELALEIMYNTNAVAAAIRMGRVDSLDNAILTGRKDGMLPLDDSIKRLLTEGRISPMTAKHFVSDNDLLRHS